MLYYVFWSQVEYGIVCFISLAKKKTKIMQGLKRHEHGNWVAILRDTLLDFHTSRTPKALTKRVTSKTFQKLS